MPKSPTAPAGRLNSGLSVAPPAPDGNLEKCRSLLDVKSDSVVRTYAVLKISVGISKIKIPIRVLTSAVSDVSVFCDNWQSNFGAISILLIWQCFSPYSPLVALKVKGSEQATSRLPLPHRKPTSPHQSCPHPGSLQSWEDRIDYDVHVSRFSYLTQRYYLVLTVTYVILIISFSLWELWTVGGNW